MNSPVLHIPLILQMDEWNEWHQWNQSLHLVIKGCASLQLKALLLSESSKTLNGLSIHSQLFKATFKLILNNKHASCVILTFPTLVEWKVKYLKG